MKQLHIVRSKKFRKHIRPLPAVACLQRTSNFKDEYRKIKKKKPCQLLKFTINKPKNAVKLTEFFLITPTFVRYCPCRQVKRNKDHFF